MPKLRFGPNTKKARLRLGWTQTELGQKLNPIRGPATISQWENETHDPSDEQRAQIKKALGQIPKPDPRDEGGDDGGDEPIEAPSAIGAWLNRHRREQNISVAELAIKAGLSAVAVYNIESGRSQNPQRKTVAKLETALGKTIGVDAIKDAKDEATIAGVGEWFDFDPNSQADWPAMPGIYVFYDISNRPIYVGQGQNISIRLRDHHQKFWFRPPIVQYAAFVGINKKELREQIEKVLIKFLKSNAVLNQQNVDR